MVALWRRRWTREAHGRSRGAARLIDGGKHSIHFATLLLRLAPGYDRLVLSAGDGDFADAIQAVVADYSTQVVIAGFRGSVSRNLLEAGAKALFIDEFWSSVERPDVERYQGRY